MRSRPNRSFIRGASALAAGALLLTACGGGLEDTGGDNSNGSGNGDAAAIVEPGTESLEGATITVGSKDFDEQLILGEISKALLEDAGATVVDEINVGGTDATRVALETGEIDHYWEYTGTAWISFFGEADPITDRDEQFEAVRVRDAEENGLYWLNPAPFNNTYALAFQADAADDLGNPQSISDFAALAADQPELATLCIETEFNARDDGLPGLEERYGFSLDSSQVTVLDTGIVYDATAQRDPCNFGEVFATDGRVAALDLVVLEDDEAFFPLYNVAPVFRADVYEQYGQTLAELYAPIAEILDNETMAQLNARVSSEGQAEVDVARDFLETNGFIGS